MEASLGAALPPMVCAVSSVSPRATARATSRAASMQRMLVTTRPTAQTAGDDRRHQDGEEQGELGGDRAAFSTLLSRTTVTARVVA